MDALDDARGNVPFQRRLCKSMDAEDGKLAARKWTSRETVHEEDNVRLKISTTLAFLLHHAQRTRDFVETPTKGKVKHLNLADFLVLARKQVFLGSFTTRVLLHPCRFEHSPRLAPRGHADSSHTMTTASNPKDSCCRTISRTFGTSKLALLSCSNREKVVAQVFGCMRTLPQLQHKVAFLIQLPLLNCSSKTKAKRSGSPWPNFQRNH